MKRAVKDATKMDNMPKSRTFHRCMTYSLGPSLQISLHSDQIIPEEGEREHTHTQINTNKHMDTSWKMQEMNTQRLSLIQTQTSLYTHRHTHKETCTFTDVDNKAYNLSSTTLTSPLIAQVHTNTQPNSSYATILSILSFSIWGQNKERIAY